jgi:hypothetical protein
MEHSGTTQAEPVRVVREDRRRCLGEGSSSSLMMIWQRAESVHALSLSFLESCPFLLCLANDSFKPLQAQTSHATTTAPEDQFSQDPAGNHLWLFAARMQGERLTKGATLVSVLV